MTDPADAGEPVTPTRKARKPKAAASTVDSASAGVAAPVALRGVDPVADLPFESAPLADATDHHDDGHHHGQGYPHEHGHDHSHEPEPRSMLDRMTDAVRGLFGRGDKGQQ